MTISNVLRPGSSTTRGFGRSFGFVLALAAATVSAPAWAGDDSGLTIDAVAAAAIPNRFVWADTASLQPVNVIVSIADQRAYVYRGEALIAVSSVSTGKDGNDTPAGTYPILQKNADHKSNLYDDAPMPFMQRLTWDGIALHAGRNPGFPASHGCIRMPTAFAKKLFAVTAIGTTVTVMDESFVPTDGYVPPEPEPDAETESANRRQLAALDRK